MPRKLGPDLFIDDGGAGNGKLRACLSAGHAIRLSRGGDEMVDADIQRRRDFGQRAQGGHGIVAFDLAEIAHRHSTSVAEILQGHRHALPAFSYAAAQGEWRTGR